MDIELFQWVLLGLLALGVVVLVALLATLGGIRKALEQRSSGPATTGTASTDAGGRAEPATTTEVAPASAHGTYPPTESAAEPAATSGGSGRADSIRSVLQQHGLSESGQQPEAEQQPAAQQDPASRPEETGVVDSVFAAHADDPQEEPFQRDGRWWFRRGDELLLYDEASGQWQPAPSDSPGASPTTTAGSTEPAGAGTAAGTGVQTTQVGSAPSVADQVATFWKCPTCGAVNGSTAATCRMCFAARP